MSKREITLAELRREFDAQQAKGSNTATVLGVGISFLLAADAYCDATGLPGPTGLLFSSVGIRNYHAVFFLTILLQAVLLGFGFVQLLKSRWQTGTAHDFWLVLKHGWTHGVERRRKRQNPLVLHNSSFWVAVTLVSLLFIGCSSLVWRMVDSLFVPAASVALTIVFGMVLAFDLAVVLFVARRDIFVVAGLTASALLITAAAFYGPDHLFPTHSWGLQPVPDFQYWESLFFGLLALAALALLFERQQSSIVFVLKETRSSLPPGVTPVPFFADSLGRAIHMMFAFSGVNAIGLYEALGTRESRVIDLDNSQQSLKLNGYSLTIWNLTSLEQVAQQCAAITDSTNCLQVTAHLHLFPTAEALRKIAGSMLAPDVVRFANDTLFNNAHLQSFLHQVGCDVFESSIRSVAEDFRRIKGKVDSLSSEFRLESHSSFYMDGLEPETLRHDTLRGIQSGFSGRKYLDEIKSLRSELSLAEERARSALQAAQANWMSAVQNSFRSRIESESRVGSDHQVTPLMQALGLSLRFSNLILQGAAAECGPLLLGTEKEIATQIEAREVAFRETARHKEDQKHEIVTKIVEKQPLSYGNAMKFLERIGAVKSETRDQSSKDLPHEKPERLN